LHIKSLGIAVGMKAFGYDLVSLFLGKNDFFIDEK
jgi:hypothetical protein